MTIHFATENAGIMSADKICQAITKIVAAAGGSAALNPSGGYITGTISFNGVDHKIDSKISSMNGDIVGAWDDSHTLVLYSGSRTPVDTFTNLNGMMVNYYVFAIFVNGSMWWAPDNKLPDGAFNIGAITVKPASSTMRAMLTPLIVGGEDFTPVFISQNGVIDTAGTTVTDTAGVGFVSLGNLLYIRDATEDAATGTAVTCRVGTVSTLPAGSQATVTNSGTLNDIVLNFGIPQGAAGPQGDATKAYVDKAIADAIAKLKTDNSLK